jgi:hypothetical protein
LELCNIRRFGDIRIKLKDGNLKEIAKEQRENSEISKEIEPTWKKMNTETKGEIP